MIYVFNAASKKRSVFLKKIAQNVLLAEGAKKDLAIVFFKEKGIQQLNQKYRRKNNPTDVLSFKNDEEDDYLGEVIICFNWIKKNAKIWKNDFETELARVLIHGILHLLGYDHEKSRAEAEEMLKTQEKYLKKYSPDKYASWPLNRRTRYRH